MQLRAFALVALSVASLAACDRETKVRVEDLRVSPVGAPLTTEQERRVRSLHATFSEVDSSPVETWIENFRRDQHPDREIAIYEEMAKAYRAFVTGRSLSQDQKDDAYGLILQRSMMSDERVLRSAKLKALTMEEAREVLKGYPAAPAPIIVKDTD